MNNYNEEVFLKLKTKEVKIKQLIKVNRDLKKYEELKDNYLICNLSNTEKFDFLVDNGVEFDELDYNKLLNRVHYLKLNKLNLEKDLGLILIDYDDEFLKLFFNLTLEYISCYEKLYDEKIKEEDVNVRLVKSLIRNINENLSYCKRLLDGEDVEQILLELENKNK